jgi:tRNA-2-methylthio-N6-dimethylallyladenosine synthase
MLAAMQRGYTVEQYLALVDRMRGSIPELALSTDIIVGFYGETEADFEATLALMREVRYDSAFSFKYSVREHTRAHHLGDSVSEDEKARRLAAVIDLQQTIALERNRESLGHEVAVLIEGPARRGGGMLAGKTPQFKTAIVPEQPGVRPGDTIVARVEAVTAQSLICACA